jgi:dTDP-4-dehydrorhamnose reductase
MLAADLCPVLRNRGDEVLATTIRPRDAQMTQLDVSDAKAVSDVISRFAPDWVLHLAAETDVDRCEREPDHAFTMNVLATENVALAADRAKCGMLYVSTGAVFDGVKGEAYTEYDSPNPVNVYGHTKLEGEHVACSIVRNALVVRAGWMVGAWERDKKFVYKIINQLREGRTELAAVDDKVGSPTFTEDFARQIPSLLSLGRRGVFHLVNEGRATRFDIATRIVYTLGLSNKVAVTPVSSAHFPLPAPRASSEALRNYRLQLLGVDQMPSWQQSLDGYVKRLWAHKSSAASGGAN